MSEIEFLNQMKKLRSDLMRKIIIAIISGLFIMIVGGGWTMAKVFNVKGKADKTYVDGFYGDMMRLIENRTLVLEQMVKAEKENNAEKYAALQKQLDELGKQWQQHMNYHMERTRGASTNSGQ